MRLSALSVTGAVVAAMFAGVATPAAATTAASTVNLAAGNGLHRSSATVNYQRVDDAVNSVKVLSVEAHAGARECVWVEWNDPQDEVDGWASLITECPCDGGGLLETPNLIIKAPKGHQLKVRLAAYHGSELVHKDIAKL